MSSAFNIGELAGNTNFTWNDSVNRSNTSDFYRFGLSRSSSFNINLTGLSADADIELLDAFGNQVAVSRLSGSASERINRFLNAGTYFIRVHGYNSAETSYTMGLSGAGASIDPGNSLSAALDFGAFTTNTSRHWTESVASWDSLDIYRFTLQQATQMNLGLRNMTADADLYLLDSQGNQISSSRNGGAVNESISQVLNAGTYYIQVGSYNGANTSYQVTANSAPPPNVAPNQLQFGLSSSNLRSTDTLSVTGGWVYDANGASDLSRVDFRIVRADGSSFDVSDPTSLTAATWDNRWAMFSHSLNLSNLNLLSGNYRLQGIAYDRSGAMSNIVTQSFTVQQPNVAPTSLQFGLSSSNLRSTDTLSVTGGWVYDANGASDLSRVDFRIVRADGSSFDVSDPTSLTPNASDNRWAMFSHSLNLANFNLASGSYRLQGIAYDLAGAMSNVVTQAFTIQALVSDWFSLNLRDSGLINLARNLAGDNNLSRNDMMSLFRDANDGNLIDGTELADLRTIVSNAVRFTMQDHVRVLSNKVVNTDVANTRSGVGNLGANSSSNHMDRLINKWFLGTDRPTAAAGQSITYTYASGGLFGNDNAIHYQDVRQGQLGDCYFLASLSANADRRSTAIRNMFIDNSDGTFTVRFYGQNNGIVNAAADYVTVDRFLSNSYAYHDNGNVGIWVALAEKAYAQFSESGTSQRDGQTANSYESIVGGWGYRALPAISGINGGYYADQSWSNTGPRAGAFMTISEMASGLSQGRAMTAGTISSPAAGIVGQHEYMVISVNVTSNTVTLYNPWGTTPSATQGVLTISYSQFRQNFNMISMA
jgi:hypothetical protein